MPKIQHLLETRFAVLPGFTSEWLVERLELLRQLSLPSVAAQDADAFTWLLFSDESTDADILEQLRVEEERLPNLEVALTSSARTRLDVIRELTEPDTDVLITTRLDSDDAIADQYLSAIQAYAPAFARSDHERLLVNFPHGYRLDRPADDLYRDWMLNSPFHSLFERPRHSTPRGVMSPGHTALQERYASYERLTVLLPGGAGWHARLHQHYPTHQDVSMAAWLIAIHGGNAVSRIPPGLRKLPAGTRPSGFTPAGCETKPQVEPVSTR